MIQYIFFFIIIFLFFFYIYLKTLPKEKHLNSENPGFQEKILHQTWKNNNFTDLQLKNVNNNKKVFKNWEYKFWDDESLFKFVKEEFPELYDFWNSLQPFIKKIDSIRYMWLYKYGGVYSDFDIEWKKNLEDVLKYENAYIPVHNLKLNYGKDKGNASPALMASNKGNIIWLMMLRYVAEHGGETVQLATGPKALSNFVLSIKDLGLNLSLLSEGHFGLGSFKYFYKEYCYHRNDTVWEHQKAKILDIENKDAIVWLDREIKNKIGAEKYNIFLERIK